MSSLLNNAQNVSISGSTFTAGRDVSISYNTTRRRRDPLDVLQDNVAFDASDGSALRPDHSQTGEVLDRIDQWARDQSAVAKPILWVVDPTGGPVSPDVIERLEKVEDSVILKFFFGRKKSRRNQKTHLIPTLAFQLLDSEGLPAAKTTIKEAIKDSTIFELNLEAQMEGLIVDPLNAESRLAIIVLSGLDECCLDLPKSRGFPGHDYEGQQREILDAIALACERVSNLRVLISSRPEWLIRTSFGEPPLDSLSLVLHLDIPSVEPHS